ncbi:hypothetical protein [Nocardia sp. NPDC020380]|uniref:hypothetical protein n=1 Tax=Nocardia sp. NPDC020380 TaxID=3364309 RepID=UPI0037B0F8A8
MTLSSSRSATTSPASPSATATAFTAATVPADGAYSALSHHRIATTRQLTSLEVRALLVRHADCTAGRGHTGRDCSARTQLLELREDAEWSWPIPAADR